MRYEYRIKVEECNNGKKYYIPQIGEPKLTFCKRSVYPWMQWKGLIGKYSSIYSPETSEPFGVELYEVEVLPEKIDSIYHSEQEAEDIINFHKEEMERTKGEEVKNVYFIKK